MKQPVPRQCFPCTACCDGWFKVDAGEAQARLGSPCPHCTKTGCGIYERRPIKPCRTFVCGWLAPDSPLPEWLRPDNSKAIVMFDQLQWEGRPAIVAVAVGARIPPRTINWLKQFAEANQVPLLWEEFEKVGGVFTGGKRIAMHGPPAFQQEMAEKHRRGERVWG